MRVLWIINGMLPEARQLLTGKGELRSSGGWLIGLSNALRNYPGIELSIASISPYVKKLSKLQGVGIAYYIIPSSGSKSITEKSNSYNNYWKEVRDDFTPDVIHVHGTEFSHGLSYVDACGSEKVVVSIQGLTSVYERYYNAGISAGDILKNITIRDLVAGSLFQDQKRMRKRGVFEIELIQKVHHIIGRTGWDRVHSWAINPDAIYHFCNETLRPEFYTGTWEYKKCIPHTLFLSQAYYPVKGFHQILKALPLVLRQYPDTIVKLAGGYPLTSNPKGIRESGYSRILRRLIEKEKLQNHIITLGNLNAQEMKDEMLKSNVFVCPSSIENSPNSLGEAQLLGVPCISSYTGGTMNMIPNESCGKLYRFDETEMLAYDICELFETSKHFDNTLMRKTALDRHDSRKNVATLIEIYKKIASE